MIFTRVIAGFVLLLVFATPLSAQDETFPVYCGTLSEADCTLLQNAYTRLPDLHSGVVAFQYSFAVGNADEREIFSEDASGVFMDFDAAAALPTYSPELFRTLRLDIIVQTSIPEGFPSVPPDMPTHIETRILMVDGMVYVDLDTLQDVVGAEYSGWGSYPLEVAPREIAEATPFEPLVTGLDAGALIGAFEPEFVRQFLTVTRDDEDGRAYFETHVDIPGLYAQPVFRELMRERLEARNAALNMPPAEITDTQLDNLARRMGELYPEPLLLHYEAVDLETGFLSRLFTWGMFDIDVMINAAINNNDITSWKQSPINLLLMVWEFNEPSVINAPENATPLDYETMMRIPIMGFLPLERPDED
ncbi:MAG: hypothetical protein H6672_20200 [Anaerolineaceae bacterium]|nr:hypothetical protein [Anaerolineaceae bacterium]